MGDILQNSPSAVARQPVEPQEFIDLAVSRRQLLRSDERGRCGLFDSTNRVKYIVDQELLLRFTSSALARS